MLPHWQSPTARLGWRRRKLLLSEGAPSGLRLAGSTVGGSREARQGLPQAARSGSPQRARSPIARIVVAFPHLRGHGGLPSSTAMLGSGFIRSKVVNTGPTCCSGATLESFEAAG